MGKRSTLERKSVDEAFDSAIINIVTGKDRAVKKYAFGYTVSTARKAGWTLYLLDRLAQYRDEILSRHGKERANYVMDLVKKIAEEWRRMPDTEKEKWIEKAQGEISDLETRLQKMIRMSKDIEKAVEEATRSIEVIAEAI